MLFRLVLDRDASYFQQWCGRFSHLRILQGDLSGLLALRAHSDTTQNCFLRAFRLSPVLRCRAAGKDGWRWRGIECFLCVAGG
jgi:hypothetical protein